MGDATDAVEVVRRFLAALSSLKPDDWIAWWHEDGVFDQPFVPEGYPARLEGIEAIHNHVRSIDRVFGRLDFLDLVVYTTEDPELVVATMRSEATVLSTGRPYANEYVALVRVRQGKVVHYREYYNPLNVIESFGGGDALDTLTAAFNIEH